MNIYELLNKLEISYQEVNHPKAYTVKEIQNLHLKIKGTGCKNLFLKDKNSIYYLLILEENKRANMKDLAKLLNVERAAYTQYETEYNTIPLIHLNTLANYFNVSIDYLLMLTDIKNYPKSIDKIDKLKSGLRIKEFRKENKLTQVKLASFLNTTHSVIADYERGRHLINTSFLYMICKKHNVSADYLLGKIDEPKYLK